MKDTYDDLEWDIDTIPIGSSTPDDLFENSYRARTKCPECGNTIYGTANYWSRYDDMSDAWLENVEYEECEWCHDDEPEEDDEE